MGAEIRLRKVEARSTDLYRVFTPRNLELDGGKLHLYLRVRYALIDSANRELQQFKRIRNGKK